MMSPPEIKSALAAAKEAERLGRKLLRKAVKEAEMLLPADAWDVITLSIQRGNQQFLWTLRRSLSEIELGSFQLIGYEEKRGRTVMKEWWRLDHRKAPPKWVLKHWTFGNLAANIAGSGLHPDVDDALAAQL